MQLIKANSVRVLAAALFVSLASSAGSARAASQGNSMDTVVFGDAASEQTHQLHADHAEVVDGGLHQPARRLLPTSPATFEGGNLTFTMKVDPNLQNYVTVKLWGSDKGAQRGRLVLFADELQVGYRHEGDYDVLNQADEDGECPGRFLYQTLPLPPSLTQGKTTVALKIISLGEMWPYGANFNQYQKAFTEPTRGLYQSYTHTAARFEPDSTEVQGQITSPEVRPSPGEEVIEQSKQVVNDRLEKLLSAPPTGTAANEQKARAARLLLLAEAYNTPWSKAYKDQRAIVQIISDGDAMARDFQRDRKYVARDWPGAGPLGEAVMRTWPAVEKELDSQTAGHTRRQAWSQTLRESVDYWRTHRRDYTNQSMIVDRNIYTSNRALMLIDPQRALPEAQALNYLYQAVGLRPWLGSDVPENGSHSAVGDAPSAGVNKPFGEHYFLVTRKGLTRELGWVATYGETILRFTHDIALLTGDEHIRQQLRKLEDARMPFRYPGVDAEGYRCMKLASEVDNRTAHYPLAGSAYTAPNIREEWWMDLPALLHDDPVCVGAAQQALVDNQYFYYVGGRLRDPDTLGMMRNVDEYQTVKALPPSSYRMPMTEGQPDFAWADEQDAIVAIKHGRERLFINLYYRAERGVNSTARLLDLTPDVNRIATVRTQTQVVSSGHEYVRPDWIDAIRSRGFPPPGETIHQAWAGETLPISARPEDVRLPEYGNWGPFLGKAAFYQLRYGNYLIGLNTHESNTYELSIPSGVSEAPDLISGKTIPLSSALKVPPLTTVVLFLGK